MRSRVHKFLGFARRFGWKAAGKVALLWILRKASGYREAIVYCLPTDNVQPPDGRGQVDWALLEAAALPPAMRQAFGLGQPAPKRFAEEEGNRVFVGSQNGVPCYFSSVAKHGFTIPGRISIRFPGDDEAYVGDCMTVEAFRGMGLYPCALVHLASDLRAEGRRRLYLFVESENLASIRGVEKAGFRAVGSCSVYGWGKRTKRRWRLVGQSAAGYAAAWTVREPELPASGACAGPGKTAQPKGV